MINAIISITTIPCRKVMFLQTLPYILKQKYIKKICINLDNNLSEEDYAFYDNLVAKQDSRIEINKNCDPSWRSANKLIPTLLKYPDDIIITMDDDFSYDENNTKEMIETYIRNPECIIAQEINPVVFNNGELRYYNKLDIKLMQKEYGKYLTNCCLFPPHVFDNTEVFDLDKMLRLTNGTHDELWFWEQTVLKGVKVIGLDQTISLTIDSDIIHSDTDYQLSNINAEQSNIDNYNNLFNNEYGEKIKTLFNSPQTFVEFDINRHNLIAHVSSLPTIKNLYDGFKIVFLLEADMKKSQIWYLQTNIKNLNISYYEIRQKIA